MGIRTWGGALAAATLVLALGGCGDDGGSSGGGGGTDGPAAPDGTYTSETGPNDESVTFDVEGGKITHLEGKVYGDCDSTTVNDSIKGDVDIAIEDDEVDYSSAANGATTTLTGSFDDGTFEGTFAYVRAGGTCPTDPLDFTASVD